MNTYVKYAPNVFLAKCDEKHEKGETIPVTTRYGQDNDSIVFNLMFERDGYFYYSIVRADGFNAQEWAKRKAEKLQIAASNADKKSDQYYKRSHEITDNIPFGQPILVGHHSEKGHRRDLDKSWNAMGKCVELSKQAESYENRAAYWEKKAGIINLSMPECLEFYEFELERAKATHEGLKNGTIEKRHSYSVVYANKDVKDIEAKLKLAERLWL
jgi:hypothetical protein